MTPRIYAAKNDDSAARLQTYLNTRAPHGQTIIDLLMLRLAEIKKLPKPERSPKLAQFLVSVTKEAAIPAWRVDAVSDALGLDPKTMTPDVWKLMRSAYHQDCRERLDWFRAWLKRKGFYPEPVLDEFYDAIRLHLWGEDFEYEIDRRNKGDWYAGEDQNLRLLLRLIASGEMREIVELKYIDFGDGALDIFIHPWHDFTTSQNLVFPYYPHFWVPAAMLHAGDYAEARRVLCRYWSKLHSADPLPCPFTQDHPASREVARPVIMPEKANGNKIPLGRKSEWDKKLPRVMKILTHRKNHSYGQTERAFNLRKGSARYLENTYGSGGPKAHLLADVTD